ncbi:MAG: ABC transporter permease [Candidatus Hinthialibacter antarcticus]|nr:ABC transporter permease [Candidatus Hinthialibacter antarcticus]
MRYEWFIAKRYLKPQGGATFIFHLTLISMIGVALGVASLVVVLSVMNGFAHDVRAKILEGISHVIIRYDNGIADYQKQLPQFAELNNVKAVSPAIIDAGALFVTDARNPRQMFVTFLGIDPDLDVSNVKDKIILGSLDRLQNEKAPQTDEMVPLDQLEQQDDPGIIIGKELAASFFGLYNIDSSIDEGMLQQVIGRRLTLITIPKMTDTFSTGAIQKLIFRVDGVFESGNYEFDSSWAYMSIPSAQYLLNLENRITLIQFMLDDFSEEKTEQTWEEIYTFNHSMNGRGNVQTWKDMRSAYFEAIKMEKVTMTIILRIIILVATFNIIATLFMVVTEKTQDIGLLRALGAGRNNILMLFLSLGTLIGFIGVILGLIIGYGICWFIQVYPIELPGGNSVYVLRYIPCKPEMMDFLWVMFYTFLISLLASIYPAFRASRSVIVDSLRFS